MARLILDGDVAQVLLETEPVEGGMVATCRNRRCPWTESYDTTDDAVEYAADHADRGPCPSSGFVPAAAPTVHRPLDVSQAVAELDAMSARDRAAGGAPWEVPTHPDHDLPGGWHRGNIQ
jgi:hypothetical protein